jgi:quercetin dioxygenase-like cupin family protein
MAVYKDAKHHFSSGVYAREMELKAGFTVKTHSHKYDHLSILAKGNVFVVIDGVITEYEAPQVIEIKANKEHEIFARTDSIWFCIHATNETSEDKIDKVIIAGE